MHTLVINARKIILQNDIIKEDSEHKFRGSNLLETQYAGYYD